MDLFRNFSEFKCLSTEDQDLRLQWEKWKRSFLYVVKVSKEKDPDQLKSLLLAAGGPELQEVFANIPGADVEASETIDPYKVALEKLDEFFAPKRHEAFERYVFKTMEPKADEPIEKFMVRVQQQAEKCNFGETKTESRDIEIMDQVILKASPELREKLLEKETLTLEILKKTIITYQAVKKQAKGMTSKGNKEGENATIADTVNKVRVQAKQYHPNCTRCGKSGHDNKDPSCPAIGKECRKCGRKDHFFNQCRTARSRITLKRKAEDQRGDFKRARVRAIDEEKGQTEEEVEESSSFIFNIGDAEEHIWCKVGGVLIEMIIHGKKSLPGW
ncbi:Reverse transcriptase [Sergentomyia squamirostris]